MSSNPPNQTLYLRNLNDKIQKTLLKETLYGLCIPYGRILDIIALKTMKMRGQAFIVFGDITSSTAAMRQLTGRTLFGKPIQAEYALSKSDVVAQQDGTLNSKKRVHMSGKERRKQLGIGAGTKRRPESEEGKSTKRIRPEVDSASDSDSDSDIGPMPPPSSSTQMTMDVADGEPGSILFVSNLPETATTDVLTGLFRKYAGFKEVRQVPGRHQIAFVEYENSQAAGSARDVLNGFQLAADRAIKVDFSR